MKCIICTAAASPRSNYCQAHRELPQPRHQRGIAIGWLYLIGLVALLAALGGIVWAVNAHDAAVDKKGYDRGRQETEADYAKRDNDQLRIANARIQELQNAARAAEQRHQEQVASLTLKLSKELKANEALKQADRDAIRNGTLRLRDPGQRPAGAANCGGSPGPADVAATGGSDAAAGGELSEQLAGMLLGEANRADAIVLQLTACQAIIIEDRRTVNGN